MKSTEIVNAITTGQYDSAELNEIVAVVQIARKSLAPKTLPKLNFGTHVQWAGKRELKTDTDCKVNTKNLVNDAYDSYGWNVVANMISVIV